VLSCTDLEKEWGKVVATKRAAAMQPCRISALCHIKSSKQYHKSLPYELPSDLNERIFHEFCEGK